MTSDENGGARNHHFVPQFYLKGFARPRSKDGRLTVFDLKTRKSFATRPRNVAARRDYNRIEIEGQDPNAIESQLALIEADADQAFRRIIGAQSIDDADDFSFVLMLIARIALSNPSFREQRDKMIGQIGSMMMRNIDATPERWAAVTQQAGEELPGEVIPYEKMRAIVEGGGLTVGAAQEALIEQEVALWPAIMPLLEQRKWTLLIAPPKSTGFITCDRPFSLQENIPSPSRSPYGVGLGCADTTIIFSISHDLAVVGTFEHGGTTSVVTEQIVAAVNFQMLQAAMRQIYAPADFSINDIGPKVSLFSQSELWRRIRERSVEEGSQPDR